MNRKSAFTLIELSMVLVIIGLIVGGIVVGQSLVRSSELRNVVSEYDVYLKAIKEFQDKYLALPGDMNNATLLWTTAITANGDGSGTIGTSSAAGVPLDTAGTGGINGMGTSAEWFLAWQHLALAGFIPGNYPGTWSGTSTTSAAGVNVPASKLSGAGWTLLYYLNSSGNAGLWSDQYGHILTFGANSSGTYSYNTGPIITAAEALDMDNKLDDGMPGTGKIRAWRPSVLASCTNDTTQTGSTYSSNAGLACALVFLLGF